MSTSTPKQSRERNKQTLGQFTTRKKSCQKCAEAKARCSLQRPICSRCQSKSLECHWFTPDSPSASNASPPPNAFSRVNSNPGSVENPRYSIESPPTLESVRIGSRWLDPIIPPPGGIPKKFTPQTIQYMSRVFKSYATVMVKDDALPPIVHPLQPVVSQQPLCNCRTLLRMWENKAPGSELLVRDTIWREMNRLFEEHHGYDHLTLLGACQAYLLYSIHLFFSADPDTSRMIDSATMINLQGLASSIYSRGVSAGLYPSDTLLEWESWIIAEAKRRTLYSMYTFDHIFNYSQNMTSYIGTELGNLPLPSNKALWAASTKDIWEKEYQRYIAEWPSNSPRLEDFWPHETEAVAKERRKRADKWVESADEFGMFMFAVSNNMAYDS
ncbi:hypothetical protein B0H19DRAFT_1000510 [Mycena capillaripes]|nr:hypothetical protein B0H19DRAFT_1000510 [Mycena capillaripes]